MTEDPPPSRVIRSTSKCGSLLWLGSEMSSAICLNILCWMMLSGDLWNL